MNRNDKLKGEIAALGDLSRSELVELWVKAYGCRPPKGIKQGLLLRAATWHLQQRRLGGLSAESRRLLKSAMRRLNSNRTEPAVRSGAANAVSDLAGHASVHVPASVQEGGTDPTNAARVVPQPGARLMREWNGRMNIVDVIDGGFSFEGKTYRSLSAIARRITGARWSGPRFFGL